LLVPQREGTADAFPKSSDGRSNGGIFQTTLYARLRDGTFPKPLVLGPQTVAFLESDVLDWMKRQIAQQNAPTETRRARALNAAKAACSRRKQERSHG
jgi:prophage regulatory protein